MKLTLPNPKRTAKMLLHKLLYLSSLSGLFTVFLLLYHLLLFFPRSSTPRYTTSSFFFGVVLSWLAGPFLNCGYRASFELVSGITSATHSLYSCHLCSALVALQLTSPVPASFLWTLGAKVYLLKFSVSAGLCSYDDGIFKSGSSLIDGLVFASMKALLQISSPSLLESAFCLPDPAVFKTPSRLICSPCSNRGNWFRGDDVAVVRLWFLVPTSYGCPYRYSP